MKTYWHMQSNRGRNIWQKNGFLWFLVSNMVKSSAQIIFFNCTRMKNIILINKTGIQNTTGFNLNAITINHSIGLNQTKHLRIFNFHSIEKFPKFSISRKICSLDNFYFHLSNLNFVQSCSNISITIPWNQTTLELSVFYSDGERVSRTSRTYF